MSNNTSGVTNPKSLWSIQIIRQTYVIFNAPVEVGVLEQLKLIHPRVHHPIHDDGQQVLGPGVLPVALRVVVHLFTDALQKVT